MRQNHVSRTSLSGCTASAASLPDGNTTSRSSGDSSKGRLRIAAAEVVVLASHVCQNRAEPLGSPSLFWRRSGAAHSARNRPSANHKTVLIAQVKDVRLRRSRYCSIRRRLAFASCRPINRPAPDMSGMRKQMSTISMHVVVRQRPWQYRPQLFMRPALRSRSYARGWFSAITKSLPQ
jgi:hypothetical protein